MRLVIGVDEAGYGPNLGPLVIAASIWQMKSNGPLPWERPAASGAPQAPLSGRGRTGRAPRAANGQLRIADSKQVYRGGKLGPLELGVLAAYSAARCDWWLATANTEDVHFPAVENEQVSRHRAVPTASDGSSYFGLRPIPDSVAEFFRVLSGGLPTNPLPQAGWGAFDERLPCVIECDKLAGAARQLTADWASTGMQLLSLAARLIFPSEFNRLLGRLGSKSNVLTSASLELVRCVGLTMAERFPSVAVTVVCDKHGGRDRYAAPLGGAFDSAFFAAECESRQESRYRGRWNAAEWQWCFRSKGECQLPVALASMTAKYLRELAMRAFNRYWTARVAGLRPTAGYPGDAARFYRMIEPLVRADGTDATAIWRNK